MIVEVYKFVYSILVEVMKCVYSIVVEVMKFVYSIVAEVHSKGKSINSLYIKYEVIGT